MFTLAKNDLFTVFIYDLAGLMQIDERQLKLFLVLAAKAKPNLDYKCNPTQSELSSILGWSLPTVQNVINSLLDLRIGGKQIVSIDRVPGTGGGYRTVYSIHYF